MLFILYELFKNDAENEKFFKEKKAFKKKKVFLNFNNLFRNFLKSKNIIDCIIQDSKGLFLSFFHST
jgi:hypothetical protein